MDTEQFKRIINKLRREHLRQWFTWSGVVNNKQIEIKCFETWLQVFRINGHQQNTLMDISVSQFNNMLDKVK